MEIKYVNIEMADNGFIVTWSQKMPGKNDTDHCDTVNHTRLFPEDNDEEAWEFYKKKKMASIKKKDAYGNMSIQAVKGSSDY